MIYSEFESDFNFPINSASDFDSTSESGPQSESDFSSVLKNLDICIFSHHSCTILNKLADGFFINSHNRINSYASSASIMHIFFWHFITKKVCFDFAVKFSYVSFYACFIINRFAMKFNV